MALGGLLAGLSAGQEHKDKGPDHRDQKQNDQPGQLKFRNFIPVDEVQQYTKVEDPAHDGYGKEVFVQQDKHRHQLHKFQRDAECRQEKPGSYYL